MRAVATDRFARALANAPDKIKNDFSKQLSLLLKDRRHKSLCAKKFDSKGRWQARVNYSWRFYFRINKDIYELLDVIPHPK